MSDAAKWGIGIAVVAVIVILFVWKPWNKSAPKKADMQDAPIVHVMPA